MFKSCVNVAEIVPTSLWRRRFVYTEKIFRFSLSGYKSSYEHLLARYLRSVVRSLNLVYLSVSNYLSTVCTGLTITKTNSINKGVVI